MSDSQPYKVPLSRKIEDASIPVGMIFFAAAYAFIMYKPNLKYSTNLVVTCLNAQDTSESFRSERTNNPSGPAVMTIRNRDGRAVATTHINNEGRAVLSIARHDENGTPIIAGTGVGAPHEEALKQCAARISFRI